MAFTALTYSFGSVLTSTKMTQNQDNFAAVANGDAGAPRIQTAGIEQGAGAQAVTTATIRDGAVTNPKLSIGAIITSNIADLAVTTAKLADLSVTTAKIANGSVITGKIAPNTINTDTDINWTDSAGLKSSFFKFPPIIDFSLQTVSDQSIFTPFTNLVPVYADNTLVTDTIPIYIPATATTLTYEAFEKSSSGAVNARFRFNVGATDGTESTTASTTLAWGSSATINVSAFSGWTLFTCKMGVDSGGGYTATVSRVRWRISG